LVVRMVFGWGLGVGWWVGLRQGEDGGLGGFRGFGRSTALPRVLWLAAWEGPL
jgi:hypothetical protein